MEDKDFNKELTESGVYQIARGIGIDISTYKANSADTLKDALSEIKHLIQKRQYENTDAQNAADFKKLEDKPNLQQQYQEIKKEEKPVEPEEKEKAEQKEQETKEKPVSMREKLSLLSGRPTKSSASKTSALQNSLNQMEKTTARTLNTVALMLRNARGQKRP